MSVTSTPAAFTFPVGTQVSLSNDDADIDVHVVADAPGALDAVRSVLGDDDAVLVKGSRAVGLEAVAHALGAPTEPVRRSGTEPVS